LWERLSSRIGLCLGLVSAAIYTVLISLMFYVLSYPTTQVMLPDSPPPGIVKFINNMGKAVRESGIDKICAAIDPMPNSYYTTAECGGLFSHNDLRKPRLSQYPAFLSLDQKPEFQDIADDKEFSELRIRQPSFIELMSHPKMQNIVNSPDMLNYIWSISEPH